MAKYTVGQEVWFQSRNEDANLGDAFVMPGSPMNIKGTITKIEGKDIYVQTANFGEVKTTEQRIEDGAKGNAKIEQFRKEQAEWDAKHADDIHATRVS